MTNSPARNRAPAVLASIAIASLMGAVALMVAVEAAAAGHGSYAPAKMLFSYTMVMTALTGVISRAAMVVAVVQYPCYGCIVAITRKSVAVRRIVGWIVVVHISAVLVAFVTASRWFS